MGVSGSEAVSQTDHSQQSSFKSPMIWWMVYLPNRWAKTCITIKLVMFECVSVTEKMWNFNNRCLSVHCQSELKMLFTGLMWPSSFITYSYKRSHCYKYIYMTLSIMVNTFPIYTVLRSYEGQWTGRFRVFKLWMYSLCAEIQHHYHSTMFPFTACVYIVMYHQWTI